MKVIIVDDKKRGQGYGKEILQLSIKYAFEILKIQKTKLKLFLQNESEVKLKYAPRSYEKAL